MFAHEQFTTAAPLHRTLAATMALELTREFTLEPSTLEHRSFTVARTLETTVEAMAFARVTGFAIKV
jgi:hypothetical protein